MNIRGMLLSIIFGISVALAGTVVQAQSDSASTSKKTPTVAATTSVNVDPWSRIFALNTASLRV